MDDELFCALIILSVSVVLLIVLIVSSYISKEKSAQIKADKQRIEHIKARKNQMITLSEATRYAIEIMKGGKNEKNIL